jgi:hypothetical protein
MLDAELNEGDLSQVTQAIQNALRPSGSLPATPRALAQRMASAKPDAVEPEPLESDEGVDESIEDVATVSASQPRPSPPRKLKTPKVLDFDLKSGTSFVSYVQDKNPPSDQMKFLTALAWFKQHRPDIPAVSADHVYTCYRAAEWSTAIADFSAPLRSLKHSRLIESAGRGTYVINHIGLDKVEKLAA